MSVVEVEVDIRKQGYKEKGHNSYHRPNIQKRLHIASGITYMNNKRRFNSIYSIIQCTYSIV